jgi:hypothetical protein
VRTRFLTGGILLIVALTAGACSTDTRAPPAESYADPEGAECIARGYEFASELYRTCRNELIDQHSKQKKPDGIY